MNMIKRFVRLTAAKYSELITGTKVDEDAFYFLEDTGELFKGSVQLTDALVVIESVDKIPDVNTIRKGRFYVDKNGGVAGMVDGQWTKFVDPKARPINYVEDASTQPAGAKEGVFYFDGVNLGVVNGASYINLSKFDASVCSLVKDATVRPQNLVNGHFYLDTKGNVGVAIQLTEDPSSLDYNLIIQPNTNYVTLSKVEDTIKEANKAVAAAYTAADTVLKQAVDEVLNTLKGQVGALEANFEEGKAKEAKVADVAHELENLPTDKIATKEESKKAVDDLKADIDARMLNKVEVVVGKQLSTEDFTTEEKAKLADLEKYTLPVASEEELGGVKVGEGLYVTDGKLNVREQDLSTYAKTADVDTKLNDYTKAVEVQTQLEAYAKKTELPSVEGLAKTTEVEAKLADYATMAEVNTKLGEKADATVIPTLATKAEVTEAVTGVAKTTEVEAKLADYAKTADIANTYATKEAINAVAGLDADTVAELKVLAQNSDLTTVAAKVANVYTKAETDTKLAAKADATAIPDVSGLATKAEVTAAVAGVQVPSIEGLAKTTDVEATYAKKTEVDTKLADYAKSVEVEATYAKKTELPDVSGLATKTEVATAVAGVQVPSIEGLAKTTEVDAKLAEYAKTADVDTKLVDYAKKTELPSVEGLATKEEVTAVDTKLADYAKTADIAETYATKEAINAVAGLDADTVSTLKTLAQNSDLTTVAEKVKNVYTKAETDDKLAAKADATAIPSIEGLAKTTDVDTKLVDYAKKTELPDVSGLATKAEVTAAVAGVQVPSIEGLAKTTEVDIKLADYAKTAEVEATYAKKTELPSIEGLAKTTEVEAKLAAKADVTAIPDVSGLATKDEVTAVDTKLADYAKTADIASTYATKEAVNAVAGLDADTVNQLKTLAQNSDLTTVAEKVKNVYTKAETDTKLADYATTAAVESTYAKKTELPDVSDLATKGEVATAVAGVQVPSIEGLAKTTEVDAKLVEYAKKTELPDVSGLATKAEVAAIAVPSIEGLAKTTEVDAKLVDYAKKTEVEETYAKKTELPDVTTLATKQEVTNAVAGVQVPSIEGLAKTTDVEATYAKKSELPSIEGLAKNTEVDTKLADYAKSADIANTYATKEAINAVAGLDSDTVTQLKALAQNADLTTVAEKVKNVYTKAETDTKLVDYAKKTELPDVSNLATKAEVAAITVPSIEGLAKTTDVESTYAKKAEVEANYAKKTELPDVSGLATKAEVTAAVAGVQVPSIEGLAKTTDVDTKLADYAKKTELPDVTTLATKAEVAAITVPSVEGLAKTTEVDAKLVDYAKKTEVEETYAKKTTIPDISGLATKAEVTAAVAGVQVPSIEGLAKTTDVEATYAKKAEVEDTYAKKTELPSVEGLAKTTEVEAKLADYAKSADIASTYATKEAINAVAGLDAETVNSLKALAQNSDLATVADKVKNVYTKAETDTKLATKADVTTIPDVSGLAVKTEVETTYAKKTELPDISGLATKAEVAAITVPSIEGLAKTTDVDAKLADYAKKTELPSIEGLAKVTDVDAKLAAKADASAIPSIEGLAKTTDVESTYAKKSELPDVTTLATKAEVTTVSDRVATLEGKHFLTSDDEENIKTALKAELVTEETLTQNINQLSTVVDGKLEEYAKKAEVESTYAKKTELPDISGLATKAEVSAAVAGVHVPDVSGLAKTTEVVAKSAYDTKVAELESTINDLKSKLEAAIPAVTHGTTEQRPTGELKVGQQFFDTTLGVPVYWNGTEWHNPFAKITTVEIEH